MSGRVSLWHREDVENTDISLQRRHSRKKGIVAFILAVLSIAIFIYVIVNSFHRGGNGSMYLGSAGVSSMLVALVAVVLAVMSLREEESFKLFPYMSTVLSFLAAGVWIAIYVIGFLIV